MRFYWDIMKILLTNDDGYKSLGIKYLHSCLLSYGDVIQAAPSKNMSACSSSLSVHNRVLVRNPSKNYYIINGTPSDCVHIASKGILNNYLISFSQESILAVILEMM